MRRSDADAQAQLRDRSALRGSRVVLRTLANARWSQAQPSDRPDSAIGTADGLTRAQAERAFRKLQEDEDANPSRPRISEVVTVSEAADSLRRAKSLEGARKSYLENLESMQRVHIDPSFGSMPVDAVSTTQVEGAVTSLLGSGRSPKTGRNLISFLYSIFEHAIAKGWCRDNPVRRAARPKRRRSGDARPDLQFLSVSELEAVLRAIPDEVVHVSRRRVDAAAAGRRLRRRRTCSVRCCAS